MKAKTVTASSFLSFLFLHLFFLRWKVFSVTIELYTHVSYTYHAFQLTELYTFNVRQSPRENKSLRVTRVLFISHRRSFASPWATDRACLLACIVRITHEGSHVRSWMLGVKETGAIWARSYICYLWLFRYFKDLWHVHSRTSDQYFFILRCNNYLIKMYHINDINTIYCV